MATNFAQLASETSVNATDSALKGNGFLSEVFETKNEVLNRIKELIPQNATVMNGSSRTLEEIGFVEYLKEGKHGWRNLHEEILLEKNETKQQELRRYSVVSDFYLGSAHAVLETGELVIVSASGSQLGHLVYTSQNVILVVGTQKITPTLDEARKRVTEHVFPLEDERMKSVGYPGSMFGKEVILHKELPIGRKVYVFFVKEKLGF